MFFGPHINFKISITLGAIKTNIFGKANYTTLISAKKCIRIGGKREEIKKVTNPNGHRVLGFEIEFEVYARDKKCSSEKV